MKNLTITLSFMACCLCLLSCAELPLTAMQEQQNRDNTNTVDLDIPCCRIFPWKATCKTVAHWKFNKTNFDSKRTFANLITNDNMDTRNVTWMSDPEFVNQCGITGVRTDGNMFGWTAMDQKFTVCNPKRIITYRIRFSLDQLPPLDGPYSHHGAFLIGFYEGPSLFIHPDDHYVYMICQNKGIKYAGQWNGSHAPLVKTDEINKWYDIIVTIDARDSENLKCHFWLNGHYFTNDGVVISDDGMRTSGLSDFQIAQRPKDNTRFYGLISEIMIIQGFCFHDLREKRKEVDWLSKRAQRESFLDIMGNSLDGKWQNRQNLD